MTDHEDKRQAAVRRVRAKRGFKLHAAIYVVVNTVLVAIWAWSGQGYFWPAWSMLGWGIGLAVHGWTTYLLKPISEEEIRREMERGG